MKLNNTEPAKFNMACVFVCYNAPLLRIKSLYMYFIKPLLVATIDSLFITDTFGGSSYGALYTCCKLKIVHARQLILEARG